MLPYVGLCYATNVSAFLISANDCKLNDLDKKYHGNISVTKGGFQCLFWVYGLHNTFSTHHNYCRAPKEDSVEIPWCCINDTKNINGHP